MKQITDKDQFFKLLNRATQPVSKEKGKSKSHDSYTGKRTGSGKTANTSGKRRGVSRQ